MVNRHPLIISRIGDTYSILKYFVTDVCFSYFLQGEKILDSEAIHYYFVIFLFWPGKWVCAGAKVYPLRATWRHLMIYSPCWTNAASAAKLELFRQLFTYTEDCVAINMSLALIFVHLFFNETTCYTNHQKNVFKFVKWIN